MVNASLNWASIVGIILIFAGFIPFFKKSNSTICDPILIPALWLCGGILFFQGWRLDPILQFGQFLLVSIVFFVGFENIKLRESLKKLKNPPHKQSTEESKFKQERVKEQEYEQSKFKNYQKRSFKSSDYLSLLGLEEDFNEAELKRAYRKEARKWHPDLNKNDKNAEAQFKFINEAYEFLNGILERERSKNNVQKKKQERFSRGFGKYTKNDLELMTDDQVYELVKLQLLAITTGETKAGIGEVEYLEYILEMLNS